MYLKNIIKTIASKSGILIINFIIVILTARYWGAEGRGLISIVMADLAIITIANNALSNSTVSFHINKFSFQQLFIPSVIWIALISTLGTFFFSFVLSHENTHLLFPMVLITSLTTFNLAVFIGKEKLTHYNFFTFSTPIIILGLLLLFQYCYHSNSSPVIYFWSFGIAQLITWIFSIIKIYSKGSLSLALDFKALKIIFNYGWKNELSSFIQFLSYRLSYFVILFYLGLSDVGIFSIGIALAESIWIISKSISLVHFARVLNSKVTIQTIKTTNVIAALSFIATFCIGLIILFIPDYWFAAIFGEEFSSVKSILLMLFPGILFMSFSNIYGHYLAGTGIMKPLVIKSSIGLFITAMLSFLLIPSFQLVGACIATVSSHFASSAYTYWAFVVAKRNHTGLDHTQLMKEF